MGGNIPGRNFLGENFRVGEGGGGGGGCFSRGKFDGLEFSRGEFS